MTYLKDAVRVPGRSAGSHASGAGPKVLHHTTEGSTFASALGAYRASGSWPTLTAEWTGTRLKIYQHMSLEVAARALEHPSGPETNRANVVQIEHVGFTDDAYRAQVGAAPGLFVQRWSDARWNAIGTMCREIERLTGCPASTSIPQSRWDNPNGWRQGGNEFFEYEGHTAHVFCPGNHHGDGRWFKMDLVLGADDSPHRNLKLYDTGPDVAALQLAVRLRAIRCGRPEHAPTVDGVFGPDTRRDAAFVGYVLGIGDSQQDLISGGLSEYVQRCIRNPNARNKTQIERAAVRRAKHCKG